MKKVPLSEVKDDLSRYLREAEKEEVVITRHGKPAGVLIGFESEDPETQRDHRQFKHPEMPGRVTVSGKLGDDVPKGTLASVKRQARLKREKPGENVSIWS